MKSRTVAALAVVTMVLLLLSQGLSCINIDNDSSELSETDNLTAYAESLWYNYSESLVHDGLERTYHVHISRSYNSSQPTPLVIVLHGGGSTGKGMIRYTGFNAIADEENFIVAYPDGVEQRWNDGRGLDEYRTYADNVDDAGFIAAMIGDISGRLTIDEKRIYATGISNGGIMTHRLGCELADRIAAICPVAGNIPARMAPVWQPSRPVPVLLINGTEDPLVPWEGGQIRLGKKPQGEVLSTADTITFWTSMNDSPKEPVIMQLPDMNPSDNTTIREEIYPAFGGGADVILYAIEGGGHTWPGAYQYASLAAIGRTSGEFNASELMWEFFEKHSLE